MINKEILFVLTGILVGLGAALYSILEQQPGLPEGTVARVNDRYITVAAYERALGAVDADKRNPLTEEDRRHILERLIDEELLIQYGVRQGLMRSDPRVKSTLVQAVLQAKSLAAEAREISEDEARRFYNDNRVLFSGSARSRVGLIRIPATDTRSLEQAQARADTARRRLADGEAFAAVQATFHEGGALNLPNTPLPYSKLVDYLGPGMADRAVALAPGEVSEPLLVGKAWQLLYLHERNAAPEVSFEEVRELVLAEMRRRASEDMLRKSLDELRRTESIEIREALQ